MLHLEEELSPVIIQELKQLFYLYSPSQISYHIRKLLISYILNERDTPLYYDELVNNMDCLLDFLEIADFEGVETDEDKAHLKRFEWQADDSSEPLEEDLGKRNREPIDDIIKFIVKLVGPEKIFFIRSNNPVDDAAEPYYDFIVIIPDNVQTSFKEFETLIELSAFKNNNVTFSLHKSIVINRQIAEGHLFYCEVCKLENIVYDDGKVPLIQPNIEKITQAKEAAQVEFTKSYSKATNFFEGAKMYLEKDELVMSLFMLQQTIELALRGILKSFLGIDIRVHSIKALLKNLRSFLPEINLIFSLESARELELLEKAYLSSRYGDLDVNEEQLNLLISMAENCLQLIKNYSYNADMP